MKKTIKALGLLVALGIGSDAMAQSVALYGGSSAGKSIGVGGTDADGADSLYIGAGAHTIDGTWEIFSSWVMIDPAAVITGSGTIIFRNPALGFGSSVPTKIDANNLSTAIGVNVEIDNDQALEITELPWSGELLAIGWTHNTANNTLSSSADINFNVDGGNIVLGTGVKGDLHLTSSGTLTGFRPTRYVVTNNSILSHVQKDAFTTFTFPVGKGSSGDYTPAKITNTSSNTVSVSVQDYGASTSVEAVADGTVATADGMNRTWHIFATDAFGANVMLQHNNLTNQTDFDATSNFVTQWSATTPNTTGDKSVAFSNSPWQTNTAKSSSTGALSSSGSVSGSNVNDRDYSALATSGTAPESYFSKSSDITHPLPLQLLSFTAKSRECGTQLEWTTGLEDGISSMELQRSTDGNVFTTLATLQPQGKPAYYTVNDITPVEGMNLYRLRLNAASGSYSNSTVLKVNIHCGNKATVKHISTFPNPVTDVLNVSGLSLSELAQQQAPENYNLRIVDMYGRVVLTQAIKGDKEIVDMSQLAHGNYILQVQNGGTITENIHVQRD
ncbi:T9SS type A sorting domain-containing protein [Rurimicrobium arvi]